MQNRTMLSEYVIYAMLALSTSAKNYGNYTLACEGNTLATLGVWFHIN